MRSKTKRRFYSTFILLFFANLTFFSGHASLNMLPAFLKNSLGASSGYIGFFMNVNSIAMILFVALFGVYSNKIDKKISLLIGFALFIASMAVMFFNPDNLWVLLAARFISAPSYAFGFTMFTNIIFDILPKEKRSSGIALFGISGIMSNPVGAFFGEKVVGIFQYKYLFIMGAFFMFIALVCVLIFKEKEHYHKDKISLTFWKVLSDKRILPYALTAFIFGGVFGVFNSFIPIYTQEIVGSPNLSFFFIPFAIAAIISRIFLTDFLDYFPKRNIIQIGFSFALISLILILFLKTNEFLIIIGIFYGFGHSLMFPTFSSAYVNMGKGEEMIIRSNTYIALNTFGTIAISSIFGLIGDIFGTRYIFISTVISVSAAVFICYSMPKKEDVVIMEES